METAIAKEKGIEKQVISKKKFDILRNFGLIFVLILLGVLMSILSNNFMTTSNLMNIARQVSVTAISAVGMTLVIIIGGIDLSVGSVIAFTGIIAAMVFSSTHSAILAILGAILSGALIGFINGVVTAKGRITGFITTLATMSIIRGAGYIITGGYPIAVNDPNFIYWGVGYVSSIPVPIIIMVIILAVGYFITNYTRFGRYVYAFGGNEQTSKWSGLNVDRIQISVYTLSGLLTAIAAVVLAARLASGQPDAGQGFELDVIAAVIVGGTSLMGGKGTIVGTLIGVLIIGVVTNGLTLLNVSTYYQMVVKGLIILTAVLIDTLSRRVQKS